MSLAIGQSSTISASTVDVVVSAGLRQARAKDDMFVSDEQSLCCFFEDEPWERTAGSTVRRVSW